MDFDGSAIDALLQGGVDDGTFHGVAGLVVDRDRVLFEGAYGAAAHSTIYRNASLTKAVTTTGALQLVERGVLDLDAEVESILPQFGDLQVLDGFDGDGPVLRAPATKPTVRQLMTHTSGIAYWFIDEDLLRYCRHTGLPDPFEGKLAALEAPLTRDPGSQWEYGASTDWLGLIVEHLSGQALGPYLAERVYGPLGMTESTFHPTDDQRSRLLALKRRAADGSLADTPIDLPATSEWDAGGHGSYGTIGDYGRFVQAWLREGDGILAPDTVELALEDHIEGIPLPQAIKSTIPELSNDVPALPWPQGWGLGFHLTKVDLPGMRSAGSAAWSGMFNCHYWIDRSAGLGGIVMTQVLPFLDERVMEKVVGFEASVYQQVDSAAAR